MSHPAYSSAPNFRFLLPVLVDSRHNASDVRRRLMLGCLGPLGIAALSVEALIILLAAGWGTWQARVRATNAPRRPGVLRVIPGRADGLADQDPPLRPIR